MVGLVVFGFIYFAVAVHPLLALLAALALGFGSSWIWHLIYEQKDLTERLGYPMATAASAVFFGSLLKWATQTRLTDVVDWLIAPMAAAGMVLFGSWARTRRTTMFCCQCRRPLAASDTMVCPRCGEKVCMRPDCWEANLSRCRSCNDRGVILFPLSEEWWAARMGKRVWKGQCFVCLQEAHEADLRECGQCHYMMCKRCWDHYNGFCQRCEWSIPEVAEGAPYSSY
jgi:hypothetical protein